MLHGPLLLGREAALQIVIAVTKETQLQLVAANGLVAALFAFELFQAATLADCLALWVVGIALGFAVVVVVAVEALVLIVGSCCGPVFNDDDVFVVGFAVVLGHGWHGLCSVCWGFWAQSMHH